MISPSLSIVVHAVTKLRGTLHETNWTAACLAPAESEHVHFTW